MFDTEMITPQQLTYVQAEQCVQHARKSVKPCNLETLRLIRAKLADLYEQTAKDSKSAEIIMIRGSIVQNAINNFGWMQKMNTFWFGDKRLWAEKRLCHINTNAHD